jgi:hypothetical protein
LQQDPNVRALTYAWIKQQYEDGKAGKPTPAGDTTGLGLH